MNNLPRISVIICSIDAGKFAHATQCYHQVLAGITHEIVGIHDARSLAEGYNRGIRQSLGDILIFSHDDVLILDQQFGQKIVSRLENYDILGFAGTDCLIGGEWGIADLPYLHGAVAHALPGKSLINLTIYGVHHWPVADNIKAIDGLCMITKRTVALDLGFDAKTFDGFHLYDIDFSFSAHRAGYRVGVCCDIPLIHYSAGSFDAKQRYYSRRFVEKHAGNLDLEKYSRDTGTNLTAAWFSDPDALTRTWCEEVLRRSTLAMLRRLELPPIQPDSKVIREPQTATSYAEIENLPPSNLTQKLSAAPEEHPDTTYNTWLKNHQLRPKNLQNLLKQSGTIQIPSLLILLRVPAGDETLLANTLDSLAATVPNWQLITIADIPPPEDLREIDCIHWISPNESLYEKVADTEADWVLETPPGTRFDDSLFLALSQVDRSNTFAVFADNDYYDNNNQRFSPRFKPGVNPSALMSADLAGPLCITRETWLRLDQNPKHPAPWLNNLWDIANKHGWHYIKHQAQVLFSLPESARHVSPRLVAAIENQLAQISPGTHIQAINRACWALLPPLPAPLPYVHILIQTDGDTGLIERCLESISSKTDYPAYRLSLLIAHQIDTYRDPDLDDWLEAHQGQNPQTNLLQQGKEETYCSFLNRALATIETEFVLFIADELVVLQTDWLNELVRACQPANVIGASPRLIQPQTGHIENCGNVLGLQGWRGSAYFRQARVQTPDDFDWIDASRDITTLTTTCALIRSQALRKLGGFNELNSPASGLNSGFGLMLADFSLRCFTNGHRLLYAPRATLAGRAEPSTVKRNNLATLARQSLADDARFNYFKSRWWPEFAHDPFWNPNLSLGERYPTLETEFVADWIATPTIARKPKILAHVIDNAQADFRITDALWHLKQQGRVSTCVWEQRTNRAARFNTPSEIARLSPDVHLVQNYINNLCLDTLDSWYNIPQRPFTIFILDDVITAIDPSSPFYKNFSPDTRTCLSHALSRCDRMVVSTDFLADYYRNFINDIRVVPNRLEMHKWLTLTPQKRRGTKVRIGWAGGTTHHRDLMLLKEVIEQTHHEADWIFFGMCPPEISPLVAESHPFIPYAQYPTFLANLGLDLAVAPLAETLFNRGKSNLRLLELGILGIPVVCTDIEPYQKSPACKVENTVAKWVSALRERIYDADSREKEGRTMREWVLQNYLLENHLDEWLDAHTPD